MDDSLSADIAALDEFFADAPLDIQMRWRRLRGELRRARRVSTSALPAVGAAAQHAALARDHATAAIEAMEKIAGHESERPPPPEDDQSTSGSREGER